ncbi:CLUMA_CG008926, isoform A [Clunio marinus]|uniref:CLUMA_CG008926, isoform A n=1 Tax=Clunio marinus TaxID=568069 RepID=A0A1J1IAK6_9DIPT|nr:CLUMA_CG008926, isoform A [Clunio marinus]
MRTSQAPQMGATRKLTNFILEYIHSSSKSGEQDEKDERKLGNRRHKTLLSSILHEIIIREV